MKVVNHLPPSPGKGIKRGLAVDPADDIQRRHEAFLDRDVKSSSFRPKKKFRASVDKVLRMLDNQVLLCLGVPPVAVSTRIKSRYVFIVEVRECGLAANSVALPGTA